MFLLLRGMLIPKFLNVILQRELETEEKRDILGRCGGGGVGAESSPVARTITAHFPTEGQWHQLILASVRNPAGHNKGHMFACWAPSVRQPRSFEAQSHHVQARTSLGRHAIDSIGPRVYCRDIFIPVVAHVGMFRKWKPHSYIYTSCRLIGCHAQWWQLWLTIPSKLPKVFKTQFESVYLMCSTVAALLHKTIPKQLHLFWTPQINLGEACVISPRCALLFVWLTQTISLIKLADLSSICGVRAGSRCLEAWSIINDRR